MTVMLNKSIRSPLREQGLIFYEATAQTSQWPLRTPSEDHV